jgi:hypothetical protein
MSSPGKRFMEKSADVTLWIWNEPCYLCSGYTAEKFFLKRGIKCKRGNALFVSSAV